VRKVLLVSYSFPPQYDVSARRAAKLCKYLPAAGWTPVVLTKDWSATLTDEDRRSYAISLRPETLDALNGTRIVHAPYRTHDGALRRLHERLGGVYGDGPKPGASRSENGHAPPAWTPSGLARRALSLFSPLFGEFPDAFRGWIASAVKVGVDVVRKESIDAICSLCPPATAHVVASEISRQTGVPWVAQFDDLYSFHLERQSRAVWRPYADAMHKRWMSRASFAGAITPAMLAYVQRTYGLDGDTVMVGFDPDESPVVTREPHDGLHIAYTGSVYPGDQRPEILFEALDRIVRRDPSDPPRVTMVFAGTGRDDELKALLARYPAAARACVFVERLPPNKALELQRASDALVLLNCTRPSASEGTLSFPAKSFEYLNAGRPILALPRDPGGWGDQLLESTHAGVTVDSVDDAVRVFTEWLEAQRTTGRVPYAGDPDEIARYGQPRQAAALARLLERAVSAQTTARALR
jgi:glycosyltransferase involved in cell wall biosynthesis